ncbi:MAG: toll/interleukin-1 receptor domain-containing protein [Clostridiales bacterium]|nr:toll/interleukin-1 receptor domain-containing protein [Clostridiales bacterium]
MGSGKRYDAFISYRHCEPDREIAERLQKKLESFRLPGSVEARVGRKGLGRIFRDETELAVAEDLSEELNAALYDSEYLIAICSPEYLGSVWCMREIEEFIKIKDRKHILLVLASGEPEEAFPEILRYEDITATDRYGNSFTTRIPREPLAADCRGESTRERNSRIDNAVVRLVAAILGIGYDDLHQRHRRQQNLRRWRRTLTAFAVLGIMLAISVFFLVRISAQNSRIEDQNREIEHQNEIISQKYADSLSAISDNLLRDGNMKAAVYAARLALPDTDENGFSEPAVNALINALGLYSIPNRYTNFGDIRMPCSISSFTVSPSGRYISILGFDHVRYIADPITGEILYSCREAEGGYFIFDGDQGFVFCEDGGGYKYCSLSTLELTDLETFQCRLFESKDPEGGFGLVTDDTVRIYKGGSRIAELDTRTVQGLSDRYEAEVSCFDTDEAWITIRDFDFANSRIYSVDMTTGEIRERLTLDNATVDNMAVSGGMIYMSSITSDYGKDNVYRWDTSGGTCQTVSFNDEIYGIEAMGSDVVFYNNSRIYLMDQDLNLSDTVTINGRISDSFADGNGIFLILDQEGCYRILGGHASFYKPDADLSSNYGVNLCYRDDTFYLSASGSSHINTYVRRQTEFMQGYEGEPRYAEYPLIEEDRYEQMRQGALGSGASFDASLIFQIIPCSSADLFCLQLWDGTAYIYNMETYDVIRTIYNPNGYIRGFFWDPANGCYYLLSESMKVFDTHFRSMFEISDLALSGFDPETGCPVMELNEGEETARYLIRPVTYSELISNADIFLSGYEPDESIREKYGLN